MQISISHEELRKRSLFIATPMYGGKCDFTYCHSIANLCAKLTQMGVSYNMHFLANESLIQRARNYLADDFMTSGLTHMIFIDSDVGFDVEHVLQLLALCDPKSDKDIVCGPYPKKNISWEKVKEAVDKGMGDANPFDLENVVGDYVFNPVAGNTQIRLDEPVEVMESGTGFMMIQRKSLETFADKYPEFLYTPDHIRSEKFDGHRKIMRYFDCEVDPKSDRYLSEDYWFCQKAREADIKVWLCPWMNLTHCGAYVFKGNLPAIATAGQAATADPKKLDPHKKRNRKKKKK